MKRKYLLGLLMAVAMVGTVPNTVQATEISETVVVDGAEEEILELKVTGDVVVGDYTYNFSNTGVMVKGYNGTEKSITIPTSVTYEGDTYKIRSVADFAFENNATIRNVVVPEGITSLGRGAFKNCTNLESIVINGDLSDCNDRSASDYWDIDYSIFYNAGANCDTLKVTFGEEVTRIPSYLFATARKKGDGSCAHVTDIVIGENVTEIGNHAFINCHDLKNISFGNKVKTVGNYAFAYGSSLEKLTLSDSIITLNEGAFSNLPELESVTFGKKLNTLGKYAFCNDTSLKEVTFSENMSTIGDYAFENCTGMTKVTISKSVNKMGAGSFKNCTSLENIIINGDIADCSDRSANSYFDQDYASFVNAGANVDSLKVTFGEEVTRVPAYLFATARTKGDGTCAHITDVEIGKNVTEIGTHAFINCHDLKNITFGSKVKTLGNYAFANCASLKELTLSDSITTLNEGAFSNLPALEKVTFGKNLNTIGKYAFVNDAALEVVNFSENVATIGEYSFENCTALKKVVLSESVTNIQNGAFKNCTAMEELIVNSDLADLSDRNANSYYDVDYSAFFNAGADATSFTVKFGSEVTRIPSYLFATARSKGDATYVHVTNVIMPDSIKEIGVNAFRNCHDLKNIQWSSALTTIGNAAFSHCDGLTSIVLPNKITNVGEYAFENCIGATEIVLSTRLETIAKGTFIGCNAVKQVEIPRSVTVIGENAFADCTKLEKAYIPSNVATIHNNAFNNTGTLTICGTKGAYAETYANNIKAKFEEVDFVEDVFPDVKAKDWFVYAVQYAYDNGIMKGKADGTFAPNGTLTRAEFATVLYNKEGKPAVEFKDTFKDVKKKDWFASPIIWANQQKIASGYGTTFGVADPITREQLALMLYKYAKLKDYDTSFKENSLDGFADKGKQSSYATEALQWAVTHGVMSGKGANLDPQGKATRGECASMIMKLNSIFED